MKLGQILLAVAALATAVPAHADDFKNQLKKMNYWDLARLDVSRLSGDQMKLVQKIRAARDEEVARSYQSTQTVSDPFKADVSIVSPSGLIVSGSNCTDQSNCTVVLRRVITNGCPKAGFTLDYLNREYQFCSFSRAYALGGVQLQIERIDADVSSNTVTRRIVAPPSCTTCPDRSHNEYSLRSTYRETYAVGIPMSLLRNASLEGDFALKLEGAGGSSVLSLSQETLIGFLRKYDEAKGAGH